MTASQTPVSAPSVVGAEPGPTPGRFDRLPLYVDVVLDADRHPLPEVTRHVRSRIVFDAGATRLGILLLGKPRSQSAWLSALGAELTALARQIEEEDR